jgi:hypothetical protein
MLVYWIFRIFCTLMVFLLCNFIMAEEAIRAAATEDGSFSEKSSVSNTSTKQHSTAGGSKTSLMELDKRVSDMERKFDSGFGKILQSATQYTGGLASLKTALNT